MKSYSSGRSFSPVVVCAGKLHIDGELALFRHTNEAEMQVFIAGVKGLQGFYAIAHYYLH
jgi:hypothetical protein